MQPDPSVQRTQRTPLAELESGTFAEVKKKLSAHNFVAAASLFATARKSAK